MNKTKQHKPIHFQFESKTQKQAQKKAPDKRNLSKEYSDLFYLSFAKSFLKLTCEAIIPCKSAIATRSCSIVSR